MFSGRNDYEGFGGPADPLSIPLSTREGTWIKNRRRPERPPEGMREAEHYSQLKAARAGGEIITRSLSAVYNCFGLVFASRRTTLGGEAVERILSDDKYSLVPNKANVQTGDIVIYRANPGSVPLHAGLIIKIDHDFMAARVTFTVISQWGADGEYIHKEDVVPPDYGAYREYYSDRREC